MRPGGWQTATSTDGVNFKPSGHGVFHSRFGAKAGTAICDAVDLLPFTAVLLLRRCLSSSFTAFLRGTAEALNQRPAGVEIRSLHPRCSGC